MQTCTNCAAEPGVEQCRDCKSAWYCSKRCQKIDSRSHKVLCTDLQPFLDQNPRPSDLHVLGISMFADEPAPKFLWVPISGAAPKTIIDPDFAKKYVDKACDQGHSYIGHNRDLGGLSAQGRYAIVLRRKRFTVDCSPVNQAATAATRKQHGMRRFPWSGNLLVVGGRHGATGVADATLAGFRAFIDHNVEVKPRYFEDIFAITPTEDECFLLNVPSKEFTDIANSLQGLDIDSSLNPTKGVIIHSKGERRNKKRFMSVVDVASTHPIRNGFGDVSKISELVGNPIRLMKIGNHHNDSDNDEAGILLMSLDDEETEFGFAREYWQDNVGDVLVAKKNGGDLTAAEVKGMIKFAMEHISHECQLLDGKPRTHDFRKQLVSTITAEHLKSFLS